MLNVRNPRDTSHTYSAVFVAGSPEFHWMSKLSSVIVCVLNLIKIDSPKLGFQNRYLNGGHWDFSFTFVVKLGLN